MRPLVRLAFRDARRHLGRTVCAVLLTALAAAAFVGFLGATHEPQPRRDTALKSIPEGARAVVTATAVPSGSGPFPQVPEGAPGLWVDDPDQLPASPGEIAAQLPGNQLLAFWNSPDLIVTTDLPGEPGDVREAGAGTAELSDVSLSAITHATLQEVDPRGLAMLAPRPTEGAVPASPQDVLVTSALAQRLSLDIGSRVTFVAAPFTGWISTNGRISEAIQNSQKTFRVTGIAEDSKERAWAQPGWMSALVDKDPRGIDGHYLVVGSTPVTWEQAKKLNELQAFVVSLDVLNNYPAPSELYPVAVDPNRALAAAVMLVAAAGLGALLLLSLVTPAFAVATEQQRRFLGLAAATGATPRDLRRLITVQGLLLGLVGGLLGCLGGIAAAAGVLAVRRPGADAFRHFPWWSLPTSVTMTMLLGWVATLLPARWAARQNPIDALRGRRPSSSFAKPRPWAGLLLLVLAVAVAVVSLRIPLPEATDMPGDQNATPLPHTAMELVAIACLFAGVLCCLPTLLHWLRRAARSLPFALKTAVRDAAAHRSRVLPAAGAVAATVMAASAFLVYQGTIASQLRDEENSFIAEGSAILGPQVPVTPEFDRAVLRDAIAKLDERVRVVDHQPVYSYPHTQELVVAAAPAPGKRCPGESLPVLNSVLDPDAPLVCRDPEHAYQHQTAGPFWLGSDVFVLDGAAMRATGRPDAEAAAQMLDAGGVLVTDATWVADEQVTVVTSVRTDHEEIPVASTRLPGMQVPGFGAPLVLSPKAAEKLGLPGYIYLGEIVKLDRLVSGDTLHGWLRDAAPLVSPEGPQPGFPWRDPTGLALLLALMTLAVVATMISVQLARTQAENDLATMHAVGATPSFLRRYVTGQAAVVLLLGVPAGLLAGLGLGTYVTAWLRRSGSHGDLRFTDHLWPWQAAMVALVVAAGLGISWFVGRTPRMLTARRRD